MIAPTVMLSRKKLTELGLSAKTQLHYQLSPAELVEQTLLRGQGELNDTGALCIRTGEFTGRSPKDKFIVKDALTENSVDWNTFNLPVEEKYFHQLKKKCSTTWGISRRFGSGMHMPAQIQSSV
jgi:phosphoenolpyruvate carboxykinase (ATP)